MLDLSNELVIVGGGGNLGWNISIKLVLVSEGGELGWILSNRLVVGIDGSHLCWIVSNISAVFGLLLAYWGDYIGWNPTQAHY